MKYRTRLLAASLTSLFFLILPNQVYSHGFGETIEKEVGNYIVDFGYDPVTLFAGEATPLSFELFLKDRTPVDFENVWVRIMEGEKTIFAGGIQRARIGTTRMTHTFPEEGEYEVSVRFEGQKPQEEPEGAEAQEDPQNSFTLTETLAETSFPLSVAAEESGFSLTPEMLLGFFGGWVLGILPLPLLLRRKKG